jgi:hypothetical protein
MGNSRLHDQELFLPFVGTLIQSPLPLNPAERSLTFSIPGSSGGPATQVTVVERAGNLVFTVDVLDTSGSTADLRGLFFHIDEAELAGLSVVDADPIITETRIGLNDVSNLGHGANMKGAVKQGFDIGIEFGNPGIDKDDVNGPVSFSLSNSNHELTLDALAHMQFGARLASVGAPGGARNGSSKDLFVAPAAPDAVDDTFQIFEDGAAGLTSPSHTPTSTLFSVLSNDTDADGDTLFVSGFADLPDHGTATISADGMSILYTPDADYAGDDSFIYTISDGNGGADFATVNVAVAAVADVPDLQVDVAAGADVGTILLTVTATQTDLDSSEYIDRMLAVAPGGLPEGALLVPSFANPGDEPDQVVQEFTLTLEPGRDYDFDLRFDAWSKETSNGDEQINSVTVPILYEHNSTTTGVGFSAVDQSIWSTGDQFVFVDDRFLGVDTGPFDESTSFGPFEAGVSGDIKLGFQSTLTFEGGEIDATASYDVTVDTNYNKTVDQLLIDTGALLTGASFSTEGPEGSYVLDFVYEVLLDAFAGIDIDFGSIDFGIFGSVDLGGIDETINLPTIDFGPDSINVLDLGSDTLGGTIEFPAPLNAFSVNFDWPDIATNGTYPPNPVVASGESNNFLELVLDLDELVSQALGSPVNPLDPPRADAGPFFADFDLLDVDVIGGLNFLQDFELQLGELTGALLFEDGSNQLFGIGDSLLVSDASLIDALGDGDGLVEFGFLLAPTAALSNETNLGFNIGVEVDVLEVEVGYDVSIPNPLSDLVGPDSFGFSDSLTVGPLPVFADSAPIGDIEVFDETFALNFGQEQVWAFA